MTFSFFAVLMIIVVALVAFIHLLQGFFSAALSAVLAVFSAVLALSYHEVLVEKFLGGRMADSAHGMMLIVLFAAVYFSLRLVFDQVVPGNIRLPALADKIGGAVLGAVAGVFAAGVLAVAAQEMAFFPAIMGYSRYEVETHDVNVPLAAKNKTMDVTDQMTSPSFKAAEDDSKQQQLLLPVDDILVSTTRRLSEGGALLLRAFVARPPQLAPGTVRPARRHRAGRRHVLMGLPGGKKQEATIDGLYWVGPAARVPRKDSDWVAIRGQSKSRATTAPVESEQVLIAVRVRFDPGAADKGGEIIRIGASAVRLVTPHADPLSGNKAFVDNYPLGTLEYRNAEGGRLFSPVLLVNNADDFLFVKTSAEANDPESEGNPGADFVFSLDPKDLGLILPKGMVGPVDLTKVTMPVGSFIEVKRLVREDLSNAALQPGRNLMFKAGKPNTGSIRVARKPEVIRTALANVAATAAPPTPGSPGSAAVTPPPAPTPPTPAPEPPAAAPAAAAKPTFALVFGDTPSPTDSFYTNVNVKDVPAGGGDVPLPGGGLMTVEGQKIKALKIDAATPTELRSGGAASFKSLAVPDGMTMIQLSTEPNTPFPPAPWAWKDQLADLRLADAGDQKFAPAGAWASYTDAGANKIVARYGSDGNFSFADFTPKGQPTRVWIAFLVPHGTKITQLTQGQAVVKAMAIDVP